MIATAKRNALELSWFSDLKFESDIKRMAVPYEITTIQFSKIDIRESQVNGARINDAIRENKVEDYTQGFLNGDTFPRPVVRKGSSGYVILSGNQRCEAIRRMIANGDLPKSVDIEVYLIDTQDRTLIEVIARTANMAHGEGDTKEERMAQAMYFVRGLGLTIKDAAKFCMVSETNVSHRIRAEDQRKVLASAGIDTRMIAASSLEPLARLDFDEAVKVKVGSLIAQHQPPAERIRQIAQKLTKATSGQQRNQAIKEFERELSEAAHESNGRSKNGNGHADRSRIPNRPRRDKFFSFATRLVNFLECENDGSAISQLDQMQITTKQDTDRANDLIGRLQFRLKVISK